MRPSEKLKRLQEERESLSEWALADALPELEAVVKWAEKFSDMDDYHGWTNKEHPRLAPELDERLAALEKALS